MRASLIYLHKLDDNNTGSDLNKVGFQDELQAMLCFRQQCEGVQEAEQSLEHETQGPEGTRTSDTYVYVVRSDVWCAGRRVHGVKLVRDILAWPGQLTWTSFCFRVAALGCEHKSPHKEKQLQTVIS
jgi:hypothetical protein